MTCRKSSLLSVLEKKDKRSRYRFRVLFVGTGVSVECLSLACGGLLSQWKIGVTMVETAYFSIENFEEDHLGRLHESFFSGFAGFDPQ